MQLKNELCLTVIMFPVAFVVFLKMNSSHVFWSIPCWKKGLFIFYRILHHLLSYFLLFFMDSQENTGSSQKFYDKLQDVFHTCNDEQQWMRVGNVCNSFFFVFFLICFIWFFLFLYSSDNLFSIQIKTKNHSNIRVFCKVIMFN